MCMIQVGKFNCPAISSAPGSRKARISLIKSMPTLAASCITIALEVSTEIQQSKRFCTASTRGITRCNSSVSGTSSAIIGRVDSPPISIIVAPSLSIFST